MNTPSFNSDMTPRPPAPHARHDALDSAVDKAAPSSTGWSTSPTPPSIALRNPRPCGEKVQSAVQWRATVGQARRGLCDASANDPSRRSQSARGDRLHPRTRDALTSTGVTGPPRKRRAGRAFRFSGRVRRVLDSRLNVDERPA